MYLSTGANIQKIHLERNLTQEEVASYLTALFETECNPAHLKKRHTSL